MNFILLFSSILNRFVKDVNGSFISLIRSNFITFYLESDSMLYAPSTIAVSALLISFSILKIPCEDWLSSIPLYLFVNEQNPFFESGYGHCVGKKSKFLDQDVCIATMIKIPFLRALMAEKGQSPTSVGENPSRFD